MMPKNLPDTRVSHESAHVNGHNIKYLYGVPENGQYRATVFLIHGWPDLSMGWRYQIPELVDHGMRVVAPDLLGFGGSDAPSVPPAPLSLYGLKHVSDTFAELANLLQAPKIILGGHDWGGLVVYRFAAWHPDLVTHVFSICTPYTPPQNEYHDLESLVKRAPQFGYQIQLASGVVEKRIDTPEQIRQLLNGLYGGRTSAGKEAFDPRNGIIFERLTDMGKSPLLSDLEMDYYVQEYSRHGLHATLNWYRTREVNFEDEKALRSKNLNIPVLYISGLKDSVLLPSLSAGMEEHIPNLTRGEVNTSHWALWEDPASVNRLVVNWLENVVFGSHSKI